MNSNKFLEEFKYIINAENGINELKSLILYLAVTGKLTKQDENENANILFEKIQENKNNLISQGKIKKNTKVFSNVPIPYKIPSNWKWVKFGDICYFKVGKTPSRKDNSYWNNQIYPWFSISDLEDGKIITTSQEKISQNAKEKIFKSNIVKKGTLLMSFKLTIGKMSILGVDGFHNEAIISIYPFVDELKEYLLKCLNGFDLYSNNKGVLKGRTLNQNSLSNIMIALPPKEEILRIVRKVDELMKLCEQLENYQYEKEKIRKKTINSIFNSLINNNTDLSIKNIWNIFYKNSINLLKNSKDIENLKGFIFDSAVKGFLVEQSSSNETAEVLLEQMLLKKDILIKSKKIKKQNNLPPIVNQPFKKPLGWCFVRLGDITLKIASGSTPTGGKHTYLKEGIPFLRSQNIWNNRLKLNDVAFISNFTHRKMKNSIVQSKDILLNITGGSLGRCTLLPNNFQEANINQHVSIIRVINPEVRYFLHICMLSPYIQNMIWSRQVGMAREGLSKKVLELFEIPLPPLEEQRKIVKKVNNLIKLCDDLEYQLINKEDIAKKLASATITQITGIEVKEKEKMKVPRNELISILKIKKKPIPKDDAPLAKILLKNKGELSSKLLWTYSELDIESFYMQLKIELANGWIEQPEVAKMIDIIEEK